MVHAVPLHGRGTNYSAITQLHPTLAAARRVVEMEKKIINQKEYLKKYLSSGDGDDKKKKKKKKMKVGIKKVKLIDDDIDLKNMRPIDESQFDIFITAEDAPQIAGIVDERGPVDFADKRRWKIVADNEDGDLTITSQDKESKHSKKVKNDSDDDSTPPRKQKKYSTVQLSPPRTSKSMIKRKNMGSIEDTDEDNDLSPPRRKSKKHINSEYKISQSNSDSDSDLDTNIQSNKIKKKLKRGEKAFDFDLSPSRQLKNDDSDLSPPRKGKNYKSQKSIKHTSKSDSDTSLPRKNRDGSDSDLSPPRRTKKHEYSQRNSNINSTKQKRDSDSDLSPPRRQRKHMDSHSSSNQKDRNNDSDLSPPRQNKKHKSSYSNSKRNKYDDLSPPRQHKYKDSYANLYKESRSHKHSNKSSRTDRRYHDSEISPSRKRHRELRRSRSRSKEDDRDLYKSKKNKWNNKYEYDSKYQSHRESSYRKEMFIRDASDNTRFESRERNDKRDNETRMKKTLDGKKAGLQDAKSLREETEAYKKREAEHFSKLGKEVTGIGQAAIVRDTKTGRKRNLEAEAAEEREKQKRQAELDEKYAKWGKGLKQVEDREEKLKDDLYEMSKPLARYADDADLDRTLREQEREGDPMLEYIKQKQIKEGKRKPDRPAYGGSFMPNRFGVKPGHRWDGVDRSNGYEKRWFETQNAMVARQEEAYKWSTSDM
ncbi:uncharacterized protein LOC143151011 [Ptiloglossa arizonensis]|uniref:uncharacterized protein LOC143151011 n=1 Tax=Ptiloglossa arizonensis TaxID=3350558 RepID=UPI003FA08687